MARSLVFALSLLTAFSLAASGVAGADDRGLGQRCVVNLKVTGGEVDRRVTTLGHGDEWHREPPHVVRNNRPVMWEGRGRKGRGCQTRVIYDGRNGERFEIRLNNPVNGAPTRFCSARGPGTFNCTVRKRPRTQRTVEIDVHIRFGRP